MSTTISPLAVVQATGVAAVDLFLKSYADFVALFDTNELAKAIDAELKFAGVSEKTKQSVTIENFFHDVERLTCDLLERGALRKIQRFGTTPEAEAQIQRLQNSARGIPRGATGGKRSSSQSADAPQEPVSKWASLTNDEYNRMSAAEVRTLRKTDPDFVAAVARLADEEAAKGPAADSTGRVYLKRADGQFFESFRNGQSVFTPSFDSRAHMVYSEAHRIITMLAGRGVQCQAFEMGNNTLTDVSPKTAAPVEKPVSTKKWRFEDSGLFTAGNNQRKVPQGQFVLKAGENLYVGSINDNEAVIKTVSQIGNAKKFTHLESAIAAAQSFDLVVCIVDHNGTQVSSDRIQYAAR
jgi:hypothetical protein